VVVDAVVVDAVVVDAVVVDAVVVDAVVVDAVVVRNLQRVVHGARSDGSTDGQPNCDVR
jgi:hypothetical protein